MRKVLMIIIATLSLSGPAVANTAQRDTVEALLIASGADATLDDRRSPSRTPGTAQQHEG